MVLEGRVHDAGVVDEEDKGGRLHPGLETVVDPERLAPPAGGEAVEGQDVAHQSVQGVGRDAPPAVLEHVDGGLGDLADAPPVQGGDEEDRRPGQEGQVLTYPFRHRIPGTIPGGDEVPFVQDQDQPLALLHRVRGGLLVHIRAGVGGVHQQQRDVGAVHGSQGPHEGVIFEGAVHAAPPAQARGVDQPEPPAVHDDGGIDGVARRPSQRTHQRTLGPCQAVQQAGLAHVGLPHDGEADLVLVPGLFRLLRQQAGKQVQQVLQVALVEGADPHHVLEPQGEGVRDVHLVLEVVHLVDGDHDGLSAAAQQVRHALVGRGDPHVPVDDHQENVALRYGLVDMGLDSRAEGAFLAEDAPRVHDVKGFAAPLRRTVDAVPGNAGRVVDDGLPASDQAVEQGGLADVGTAYDGDEGHVTSPACSRSSPCP